MVRIVPQHPASFLELYRSRLDNGYSIEGLHLRVEDAKSRTLLRAS
jgi:hypothetical protein